MTTSHYIAVVYETWPAPAALSDGVDQGLGDLADGASGAGESGSCTEGSRGLGVRDMKYLVTVKGEGEGCDYTMGCNRTFEIFEAENDEAAKAWVLDRLDSWCIYEDDLEDDLETVILYPIDQRYEVDLDGLRAARKKEEAEEEARTKVAFINHGLLNTRLVMDAAMMSVGAKHGTRWLGRDENGENLGEVPCSWSDDPLLACVWRANERIGTFIKLFDNEVWLAGLGREYMDKPERGYRAAVGETGETSVMLYALAGRVMITFGLGNGSQITAISDDCVGEDRMGLQSIAATEAEATKMLMDAIGTFREGSFRLYRDENVKPDVVHMIEALSEPPERPTSPDNPKPTPG